MLLEDFNRLNNLSNEGLGEGQLASIIERAKSPVLEKLVNDLYKDFPEYWGEMYLLDKLIKVLIKRQAEVLNHLFCIGIGASFSETLTELDLIDSRLEKTTVKFRIVMQDLCAKNPYKIKG